MTLRPMASEAGAVCRDVREVRADDEVHLRCGWSFRKRSPGGEDCFPCTHQ
jgi:hypothetical protein